MIAATTVTTLPIPALFDVSTSRPAMLACDGHAAPAIGTAVAGDGKHLVSISRDGSARVSRIPDGSDSFIRELRQTIRARAATFEANADLRRSSSDTART